MKIYIYSFFLLCNTSLLFAQQDPQFSQYLFNGVVINPAYAGSREYVNINGLYRKQWVSAQGSPTSQTLSMDAPLLRNRAGIGAYVLNDQYGPLRQTSFYANFAFRVKVSNTGRLALGIAAGATQYVLNGSQLNPDPEPGVDPAVPTASITSFRPNAKVGLYFNTNRFFAGITMDNIVNSVNTKSSFIPAQEHQYYFSTGAVIGLAPWLKIRPSILIKEDFKSPANIDLSNFFLFLKDKLWIGGSYRTGLFGKSIQDALSYQDAVALMIEVFPVEQLRIGYAYDITLTDYKNYATHEISLGFYFIKKPGSKMLTPRYF
jgi:type IX secretion system PorP/SprF family membrane protein